jgi:hypothetical protein
VLQYFDHVAYALKSSSEDTSGCSRHLGSKERAGNEAMKGRGYLCSHHYLFNFTPLPSHHGVMHGVNLNKQRCERRCFLACKTPEGASSGRWGCRTSPDLLREPRLATSGARRRTVGLELFRPTRRARAPKWLVERTAPFLMIARSDSDPGLCVKRMMSLSFSDPTRSAGTVTKILLRRASHRARTEVCPCPLGEDDSEIFHVCPQPGGRVLALRRKPRTTH